MKNSIVYRLAAAWMVIVFLTAGAPAKSQTIENRHVYSLTNVLADEVELIREVMGRPYDDSPRMPVSGVTIFELYFQAQTLLQKSNKLAQELADAQPVGVTAAPARNVGAADIYSLVERALEDIRLVKSELGIDEAVVQASRDAPIAPTGIFSVVLDTNRQLNLLLADTIQSADVYDELNTAIASADRILASRGSRTQFADVPFEGHRRPADVYARVLECIDIVASVASQAGIEVVRLSSRRNVPDDVEPGHVYDLANILVADVALLAASLGVEPPEQVPTAGRPTHIFPSHAFERASILKMQLELLATGL